MVISGLDIFSNNNSSLTDIVFISHIGQFMGILYNNGNGQFSDPEYYNLDYYPSGLACGDLNGDGREDILVSGGGLEAWLNLPSSLQYHNISDDAPVGRIKIADIDQDGDNDIVGRVWGMPGVPKRLYIYSNDGIGNFNLSYDKWIDEAMSEIFISDLNNDNYLDIIYNVSYSYPNSEYELFHTYILFNNQDGTFQDHVNYYTGICSHKSFSADLDGNGWNDIITLNYDFYNPPPDTGTIHILFNDGTGNFVEDPQLEIDNEELEISNYELLIYPNPFNINTSIKFSLKEAGFVELKIYDIKGRLVKELTNKQMKGGEHNVVWNGKDRNNRCCSSGIYLMNLKLDEENVKTKKIILIK